MITSEDEDEGMMVMVVTYLSVAGSLCFCAVLVKAPRSPVDQNIPCDASPA